MSTEYTLYPRRRDGSIDMSRPRVIGLSAGGWYFYLRTYPDVRTLHEWALLWEDPGKWAILNEYGEEITKTQMRQIIARREWPHSDWMDNLEEVVKREWENNANFMPDNMMRPRIDEHVIGHPKEGTWVYVKGEEITWKLQ